MFKFPIQLNKFTVTRKTDCTIKLDDNETLETCKDVRYSSVIITIKIFMIIRTIFNHYVFVVNNGSNGIKIK
jgi:hypothetical protein